MKKILLYILIVSAVASAQDEFTLDSVQNVCRRVAKARLRTDMGAFWQMGTYYAGIMALYYMTQDQQYLDSAVLWATKHEWKRDKYDDSTTIDDLDNITCEQTYFEIYLLDPSPENLYMVEGPIGDIQYLCYTDPPGSANRPRFAYSDIMFMGGPNYPRAAMAAEDPAILDSLYVIWSNTASDLWHPTDKLFWRGASSIDLDDPDIIYWGRGNGWVIGSACRILQYLPQDHSTRDYYEQTLIDHCEGLLPWQQSDGLWRSDITHPNAYPNKETSGTAFFCFGMCYGINSGILDREKYEEPAKKAWTGLLSCIRSDGRVGFSQPPGWQPGAATIDNTSEYTEGAFLMAGFEMYKLLGGVTGNSNKSAVSFGRPLPQKIMTQKKILFTDKTRIVSIPEKVKGMAVYDLQGRNIWECDRLENGVKSVTLPKSAFSSGMVYIRYRY